VQALPVQALLVQALPVQALLVQALPVQALLVQALPVQALPVQALLVPFRLYQLQHQSPVHLHQSMECREGFAEGGHNH
jgi:hypothetical protein